MPNIETIDLSLRRSLEEAATKRTDSSLATTLNRVRNTKRVGVLDDGAEPEGVITDPKQFDKSYHGSTEILCKDIAEILVKRYGGWAWAVQPNEFREIINIYNLHLHTEFGYTIRMVDIMDDPNRKQAVVAGHEILRRFNMPDRFSASKLVEAPRDAKGQCIPDISDFPNKKMVRDAEVARKLATGEWQIVEANGMRYLRTSRK
jgi:hypothetical protein